MDFSDVVSTIVDESDTYQHRNFFPFSVYYADYRKNNMTDDLYYERPEVDMIVKVDENNIYDAAVIHSESWKDSHKGFCNTEFIEQHTVEHQKQYLEQEIHSGKDLYMLVEDTPVGIVSIQGSLIENLYIRPNEQRKGYGTTLLKYAINKCIGEPTLWILENNQRAYNLYTKYGFCKTGKMKKLSESLSELEMNQKAFPSFFREKSRNMVSDIEYIVTIENK